MKNTDTAFLKPKGLALRIDYLFAKKDYAFFINNLNTLHRLLDNGALGICIPFKLKETEVDVECPFKTYKYQFPQKTTSFVSMESPNLLDGLEYLTEKKCGDTFIGFTSRAYSKNEKYLATQVFQDSFFLNPEHATIEYIMMLLAYCSEKEIFFLKKNLLKDKERIIDIFGEEAYNFLLKIFSYNPKAQISSTVIIKKQYCMKKTRKKIFSENKKFIVSAKEAFFAPTEYSTKENYYRVNGQNRISPAGENWSKLAFNVYFSKKTRKVIANTFVYEENLPKRSADLETFLKEIDTMICKMMNFYNNLMAIYNYLIEAFKGEILINKL